MKSLLRYLVGVVVMLVWIALCLAVFLPVVLWIAAGFMEDLIEKKLLDIARWPETGGDDDEGS